MNAPTVAGSSQEYVGAVLGQDPQDYWRLGDTGGGFTALNQVDGEQAFYSQSISQAQPGPFPDAFSSTFNVNGTGSFVLPENLELVTGASESVSLWFKTTATGQVLAGGSADQIGAGTTSTTTSGFVPVLYVGADGRLQGQFYTGSAANTISTSTAVNDGHWHNAVLTAGADPAGGGGSQQEDLYLDGQLVAHTLAGQGATGVQANNTYFGAGFLGGSWPDIPAADQTAGKGTTAGPGREDRRVPDGPAERGPAHRPDRRARQHHQVRLRHRRVPGLGDRPQRERDLHRSRHPRERHLADHLPEPEAGAGAGRAVLDGVLQLLPRRHLRHPDAGCPQ